MIWLGMGMATFDDLAIGMHRQHHGIPSNISPSAVFGLKRECNSLKFGRGFCTTLSCVQGGHVLCRRFKMSITPCTSGRCNGCKNTIQPIIGVMTGAASHGSPVTFRRNIRGVSNLQLMWHVSKCYFLYTSYIPLKC